MRTITKITTITAALCGALFLATPATAADGPHGNMQMCSKHLTPGILGGLLPHNGTTSESCLSTTSSNASSAGR
jgi:hypothetical protein